MPFHDGPAGAFRLHLVVPLDPGTVGFRRIAVPYSALAPASNTILVLARPTWAMPA